MANSGVIRQRGSYAQSYNFVQHQDESRDFSIDHFGSKFSAYAEKVPNFPIKANVMEMETPQTNGFHSTYVEDNSWAAVALSVVKIVGCFVAMLVTTVVWAVIMVILLPWPYARIKQGNIYGHVTGRMLLLEGSKLGERLRDESSLCTSNKGIHDDSMWILGNPVEIKGAEYSNLKAIYVCNHASPLDIFLIMWLTPTGTVGIAKKEIIWYPLFGQIYILANHLRIDRSNPKTAIESMKKAARTVVEKNLSLVIFPEGTRSKTGRLLPFKKGFVHMAIQSRRPIVPVVLTGTHLAWKKDSLRVRPAPLTVAYLPPISTEDWTIDKVDEKVEMLHSLYVEHLPDSQKPSKEQE